MRHLRHLAGAQGGPDTWIPPHLAPWVTVIMVIIMAITMIRPPMSWAELPAGTQLSRSWPVPCLDRIAQDTQLSRSLLQAIVWVESRGEPWALNVNLGGSGQSIRPASRRAAKQWLDWLLARGYSVDVGLMQINSRHLDRFRFAGEELLDPCVNLRAGARILNDLIARHGETWRAIMKYNGSRPEYAHRVQAAWTAFRQVEERPQEGTRNW